MAPTPMPLLTPTWSKKTKTFERKKRNLGENDRRGLCFSRTADMQEMSSSATHSLATNELSNHLSDSVGLGDGRVHRQVSSLCCLSGRPDSGFQLVLEPNLQWGSKPNFGF